MCKAKHGDCTKGNEKKHLTVLHIVVKNVNHV